MKLWSVWHEARGEGGGQEGGHRVGLPQVYSSVAVCTGYLVRLQLALAAVNTGLHCSVQVEEGVDEVAEPGRAERVSW